MDETWHSSLIMNIASAMHPVNYLELGTAAGTTITSVAHIISGKAVGVDRKNLMDSRNKIEFYHMSTDEFFNNPPPLTYDLIFIDADHKFEQAKKDFLNAVRFLNDNGIVVIHDTYPGNADYLNDDRCSDSYRLAWEIRTKMNRDFEIVTIPVHPGLSIIRKSGKQLSWM